MRSKKLFALTAMASLLLALPIDVHGAACWQQVGEPIQSATYVRNLNTEVIDDNTLVINYGNEPTIFTKAYIGSQWTSLSGGDEAKGWFPSMTVDSKGVPYVVTKSAGTDGFSITNLFVKKFAGGKWTSVGISPLSPFYQTHMPDIAVNGSGVPYVLFQVPPDHPNPPSKPINYNSGLFNKTLNYGYLNGISKLSLVKLSGNRWEHVGPVVFNEWHDARSINLAFDNKNRIYVAYNQHNPNPGINAYKDPENTEKVYTYESYADRVVVKTYNDAEGWQTLGGESEDLEMPQAVDPQVALAVSAEGAPWIAYQAKSKDTKGKRYGLNNVYSLRIKVYEGGTWKEVTRSGLFETASDEYNVNFFGFALDSQGLPWVAYQYDVMNQNQRDVEQYGVLALKRCVKVGDGYSWVDMDISHAKAMDGADGVALTAGPKGSMYLTVTKNNEIRTWRAYEFKDVSDQAWYSKAVKFIVTKGISTGTDGSHFSPDVKLTRGQFMTMVMRAYQIPADDKPVDNFSDAGNTYYTGYLAAAKRMGISKGAGNNRFAPEAVITRQEMFTLLYNTLNALKKLPEATNSTELNTFKDANQVAPWATEAMTRFVKTGVIAGSNNALLPMEFTDRAQMAHVLYGLLNH